MPSSTLSDAIVAIAAAAAMLIDGHSHSRLCTALGS
jgi:hypothetical protein